MSAIHLPIRPLLLCLLGLLALAAVTAHAQTQAPASLGPSFEELADKAGVIFLGTVARVEAPSTEHPVATVTFSVSDGIRGVQTGEVFTLREWGALWNSGDRYRVGKTLVVFLHSPDRNGLSSPIAGVGRIEITAADAARISDSQRKALLRSARLRPVLFPSGERNQTIHSDELVRALRIMTRPTPN